MCHFMPDNASKAIVFLPHEVDQPGVDKDLSPREHERVYLLVLRGDSAVGVGVNSKKRGKAWRVRARVSES